MFNKLTQFGYVRTNKEAFGFYLAWLLVLLLLSIVLGSIVSIFLINPESALYQHSYVGVHIGMLISMIACTALTILIAQRKKVLTQFRSILLILCTAILSFFFGGVFGLIIPAYLTTHSKK